ncbi:hypothetical protein [Nitrosomonas ureae]|uniref:Uncharacterized protein n=1 Tax=Nitrosomonas ureae TaxID=44577 RepID=A0A1H9AQJ5_9PROT|nr:hypothetical protein [Nitrosomonas ureae]SEP79046.1 hypothetical protein SAMN05421510_1004106 [Nitrosomonas ureae]
MLEPFSLAGLAAIISAMVDVIRLGKETYEEYLERREGDPAIERKARALETAFSTYSPEEIAAISARIHNCRRRFIEEGAGDARHGCLCSVLRDVRDGNGGSIPDPEWEEAYRQLKCAVRA